MISVVLGICIGTLLCCIVLCFRRQLSKRRCVEENPAPQTTDVDTTYEEIDLPKMISARSCELIGSTEDKGESDWKRFKLARDTENCYYNN